jgi:hypothetical protein
MAEFSITPDDVRDVWPADGCCPALGIPLRRGKGFTTGNSPTLDRLNAEWGYTPDNIAVISMRANTAKGGLTSAELQRIVQWMNAMGLS